MTKYARPGSTIHNSLKELEKRGYMIYDRNIFNCIGDRNKSKLMLGSFRHHGLVYEDPEHSSDDYHVALRLNIKGEKILNYLNKDISVEYATGKPSLSVTKLNKAKDKVSSFKIKDGGPVYAILKTVYEGKGNGVTFDFAQNVNHYYDGSRYMQLDVVYKYIKKLEAKGLLTYSVGPDKNKKGEHLWFWQQHINIELTPFGKDVIEKSLASK